MTFSQIPYKRADLDHWKALVEDLTTRFKAAETFEEADAIYQESELATVEYDTMVQELYPPIVPNVFSITKCDANGNPLK